MWNSDDNSTMNGSSEIGPNVPAFLVKLWKLVEDPNCKLISWSESGMSFIIVAQARFAREVLPLHYKHNNMASFIRQLNMYDFHKVSSAETGALRSGKDELEFAHQFFIKDHPYLLENIKRKMSSSKSGTVTADSAPTNATRCGPHNDIFSRLLSDVNILKGKQESWDARLSAMKRENEALWRELAVFRQKHLKQEQIINRLIHFIVTIVQPSRKVPIPRRFPLMLNDTHRFSNVPNTSASGSQSGHSSPPGPTIHEIDNDVLIGGNERGEPSGLENDDFISTNFSEPMHVQPGEPEETNDPVLSIPDTLDRNENPSDWLEIVLTEDDMVTPLTPVDPAEVNPAVAAATMKHMESNNKITIPVTMEIPSIVTTDGKKKRIPEKKIVYLAEIPKPEKPKKKQSRQPSLKNESKKTKGTSRSKNNSTATVSSNKSLASNNDNNSLISKILSTSGKRPSPSSASGSKLPAKRQNIESTKTMGEAISEYSSPFPTPNSLENILKCNMLDLEAIVNEDYGVNNPTTSDDSFWKLESLYNSSIGVGELISESSVGQNPVDEDVNKAKEDFAVRDNEKTSDVSLCDLNTPEIETPKQAEKNYAESSSSNAVDDFPSDALAVVCQSSFSDEFPRELSSHVDNVQGEIDYLKEVLKGEGYNLDINNILGYFGEDPLAYGLLPPVEEEPKEKENEKGITGNEVMAYNGTPSSLMDLVDMFGSPGTVQDWSNVISPTSPTISELLTPVSSPNPSATSKSGKRRKT